MKILRKVLLGLGILLLLLILVSFFLPSEAFVERSIYIRAPRSVVFAEVSNLRRFNNWSAWYKRDTIAKYTYAGPEAGGEGSEINWDGEVFKQGKMIVTRTVPYDSVVTDIYYGEDLNLAASADFYLSSIGSDSTELLWTFRSPLGMNPWNRYMGLMMAYFIGPSYEASLQSLKTLLETAPPTAQYDIQLLQIEEPRRIIGARGSFTKPQEASQAMTASFEQVRAFVESQGIENPDYASVYFVDPSLGENAPVSYIAGILKEQTPLPKNFEEHVIPQQKYLRAIHVGSYEKLSETHAALQAELQARKLTLSGNSWETYPVHEETETDTSKWETHIYYPVQPETSVAK